MQGIRTQELKYFKLANTIFPFDKSILTGTADICIKLGAVNIDCYRDINLAFYYDPYSINLYSSRFQYALLLGDELTARSDYDRLKTLAPNLPIIKKMVELGIK